MALHDSLVLAAKQHTLTRRYRSIIKIGPTSFDVHISGAARPNYRFDYRYEKAFDTFYKLHSAPTTWAEARIRCQAEGSELLVVDSLDEADAVVMLITLILNKYEGIFVGIHDLYSERSFITIRGEPNA